MRAIPERLRGVFMTRCYTNLRVPYLTFMQILNQLAYILSYVKVFMWTAALFDYSKLTSLNLI